MTDNRANLKIPRDLFQTLKDDKREFETWPNYLHRLYTEVNNNE